MSIKITGTNILATIVAHKLKEVAVRKNEISITQLEAMPLFSKSPFFKSEFIKARYYGHYCRI